MSRSHQAIKAATWNYIGRVSDYGLLFLTSTLIARTLGPAKDSIYTVFGSVVATSVTLTGLGLDWVVYKYVAQFTAKGEATEAAALLRKTLILRLFTASIGAFVVYVFINNTTTIEITSSYSILLPFGVFAALFTIGQNMTLFGTAALTASLRTKEVFLINGSVKAALLIVLGVIVYSSSLTPSIAIEVVTIAIVITGAVHVFRLMPRIRGTRAGIAFSPIMMFGAVLFGNDIISYVLGRQSDILVLGYWYPGNPIVSIYDKAFQSGLIVEFLVTVGLSGVLFSVFAELAARAREQLTEAYQRTLAILQLIYIPVTVGVIIYAPMLISVLYGSQYAYAAVLLRAFLLLDILDVGIFGGGLNVTLLNTINRERFTLFNRCVWGVVNLGANLYLIPRYGALAALITTRACDLGAVGVEHIVARRAISATFTFRWLAMAGGAACAGIIATYFIPRDSFLNCVSGGIVFVLLVAMVYYYFKPAPMIWAWQTFRAKYVHGSDAHVELPLR